MKKNEFGLLALSVSAVAFANTPVPDFPPIDAGQHVVINIPQQRLFVYTDGKLTKAYPVAVGKALTQTTLGEHKIGAKAFNPTWHIPKSIQKERNDGIKTIPPGPKNPLGPVFVRMGDPKLGLGIHGTNAPSSVPGVRSHGCVRMKSPDALEFANAITSGSPASVIYQMAALNTDANNNLWLAAFRDPYDKKNLDVAALRKSINAWAKAHGKNINAKRVEAILKNKTGQLNCLTCAKGIKLKGPLQSLAWTNGLAEPTKPKAAPVPPPVKDEVLPSGTAIEVDEEMTKPEPGVSSNIVPAPVPTAPPAPKPAPEPSAEQYRPSKNKELIEELF
ncbi:MULTISPECIES: L,D-transpeptidase [unclassified Neisseria]|uniref:L,D-transpeptidase n=1 Tax=unclassified Neisseria TaxID=2623750 RepID=UPI00266667B5|nr:MULTISPECIES: L,D-transpeptidase [unclassified Neisseria]MDO1509603.1 L,D-transpeptidase [Neisseria sp. MVDL19-042950]MDO1515625.1 L,D-transpeptidase [Neisseria sp. MVDL18-041461]MDO1564050.1 L,D-transpeptidase [Neisseria sp. MVDL20-010259]